LKIFKNFLGEKKLLPTSFKTCKNHILPVEGKLLTILCHSCNSAIGNFRKKLEITKKKLVANQNSILLTILMKVNV
jgi:hypothetical protein